MKHLYAILFIFAYSHFSFAQKNSIKVEHGLVISNAPLEALASKVISDNFYDRFDLARTLITPFWGFSYQRKLSHRFKLGIKARRLTEGARSQFIHNPGNNNPNAGGTAIYGRIFTTETGLTFSYTRFLSKRISYEVGLSPAITTVEYIEREIHTFRRVKGVELPTGSRIYHGNTGESNIIKRYIDLLKIGSFKGTGYLFGTINFHTKYTWLSFHSTIELGGSTKIASKDKFIKETTPDGYVFKGMIHFGTSINL